MKKYLSLIALLVLAGCAAGGKSSVESITSQDTTLETQTTTSEETTNTTSETSEDATSESTGGTSEEQRKEASCKIDFTTMGVNAGSSFDNGSGASNLSKLKDHLNKDASLVSSLTVVGKVSMNACKRDAKTLCLGSGSAEGSLTINFVYQVKSIKVNVENYWKWVEYTSSYSMDTASKFTIGENEIDLSVADTSVEPTPVEQEYSYSPEITTITMANNGSKARVLINSIEITYYTK